jgi:hypothetical protein
VRDVNKETDSTAANAAPPQAQFVPDVPSPSVGALPAPAIPRQEPATARRAFQGKAEADAVAPSPPPSMPAPPAPDSVVDAPARAAASPSAIQKSVAGPQARGAGMPAPETFLARIVELRKSGDDAAAAAQLRAFRLAYADADRRLPPELRDWAATIKP